jgi:hypothetical protein
VVPVRPRHDFGALSELACVLDIDKSALVEGARPRFIEQRAERCRRDVLQARCVCGMHAEMTGLEVHRQAVGPLPVGVIREAAVGLGRIELWKVEPRLTAAVRR